MTDARPKTISSGKRLGLCLSWVITISTGCAHSSASHTAPALSDAEVLGVLDVIHGEMARHAHVARTRSISGFTREQAEALLAFHVLCRAEIRAVASAESLSPSHSSQADAWRLDLQKIQEDLTTQIDVDFDRTFLGTESRLHADIAEMIRHDLLPRAQSAGVQRLLRDLIAHHARTAAQARRTFTVSPFVSPPLTPLLPYPKIKGTW